MIKARVISVFRDKADPDEIIPLNKELELSKERYEELKEYVEIIKDATNKNNKQEVEN